MIEHDDFVRSAADARLDKQLLALKRFTPSDAFQGGVMARVRMPSTALVRIRQRAKSMATPRRLWWASGLAAASSAAWTVSVANWLSSGPFRELGARLGSEVGVPAWSGALELAAHGTQALGYAGANLYASMGNALFGVAAFTMILPALSSLGLYLSLKQNRVKRIAAHAAR